MLILRKRFILRSLQDGPKGLLRVAAPRPFHGSIIDAIMPVFSNQTHFGWKFIVWMICYRLSLYFGWIFIHISDALL